MASAGGKRGIIAEINVTPLVDIMLVLLIIFMLTANLIAKQAIEVELPRASQSTSLNPTTLGACISTASRRRPSRCVRLCRPPWPRTPRPRPSSRGTNRSRTVESSGCSTW